MELKESLYRLLILAWRIILERCHELAHELLHGKDERKKLSKEIKEMEAEAIAFVVMDHYHIELKSDKYLALYKESYDLKKSLERINKVSSEFIEFVDYWFKEKEKIKKAM